VGHVSASMLAGFSAISLGKVIGQEFDTIVVFQF